MSVSCSRVLSSCRPGTIHRRSALRACRTSPSTPWWRGSTRLQSPMTSSSSRARWPRDGLSSWPSAQLSPTSPTVFVILPRTPSRKSAQLVCIMPPHVRATSTDHLHSTQARVSPPSLPADNTLPVRGWLQSRWCCLRWRAVKQVMVEAPFHASLTRYTGLPNICAPSYHS
jgi:hypothetical protein